MNYDPQHKLTIYLKFKNYTIKLFNDNEIILTNSVYESYSVFDLNSLIWTIYYSKEINIYQCNV